MGNGELVRQCVAEEHDRCSTCRHWALGMGNGEWVNSSLSTPDASTRETRATHWLPLSTDTFLTPPPPHGSVLPLSTPDASTRETRRQSLMGVTNMTALPPQRTG
uniref:hypothetical protein n=1 Tax=Hassallia byssoidea TaxID=482630 RepID=UPI0013D7AE82